MANCFLVCQINVINTTTPKSPVGYKGIEWNNPHTQQVSFNLYFNTRRWWSYKLSSITKTNQHRTDFRFAPQPKMLAKPKKANSKMKCLCGTALNINMRVAFACGGCILKHNGQSRNPWFGEREREDASGGTLRATSGAGLELTKDQTSLKRACFARFLSLPLRHCTSHCCWPKRLVYTFLFSALFIQYTHMHTQQDFHHENFKNTIDYFNNSHSIWL